MPGSCVLFSGGLDSAVLLALEQRDYAPVQPVHVRSGLAWENAERLAIDALLHTRTFAGVKPVMTIGVDMRDVYPRSHWALTGTPPAYDTPDEDVYLDGRNILLISKAAVLCARLGLERIALGLLSNNPFPDATPAFFAALEQSLSLGLNRDFTIARRLTMYHKEEVIRIGTDLGVPLELSLSCMSPSIVEGDDESGRRVVHCGGCSKCRERQDGFGLAGIPDKTTYATAWKRQ